MSRRKDPEDRELIVAASRYRENEDSWNSHYMGGMATAQLGHLLGGASGAI
jgi:hypothetical protein